MIFASLDVLSKNHEKTDFSPRSKKCKVESNEKKGMTMWKFFEPSRLYVARTNDVERFRVAGFCNNWGEVKESDKEDWAVDVDLSSLEENQITALFDDVPFELTFQELKAVKTKQYEEKFDIICACRLYQMVHQEAIFTEHSSFIGAR